MHSVILCFSLMFSQVICPLTSKWKYFGKHSLKIFVRGKPSSFGCQTECVHRVTVIYSDLKHTWVYRNQKTARAPWTLKLLSIFCLQSKPKEIARCSLIIFLHPVIYFETYMRKSSKSWQGKIMVFMILFVLLNGRTIKLFILHLTIVKFNQ